MTWILQTALGLAAAVAISGVTAVPAQADPVVAVDSGLLRGTVTDGVKSWKGIPFATPPVGALRWRAPQPAAPWPGVRDAAAYGNDCMQLPYPDDAAPLGVEPAEDCLYLNVWRPALAASHGLPVVVWIHGGGYLNGGGSPETYAGTELARQGVVVASFNYRLGRFGTFAHPALTAERADGDLLGNYGTMDQIVALQWIQHNIGAFGGDPGNVTVMGESAGGMSIHNLLTSPRARGLMNRAVIMSGGDALVDGGTVADAEKFGVRFASTQGIDADDPQALDKLRSMPAEQIRGDLNMAALFGPHPGTYASPFVDGVTILQPESAYRAGDFDRVPILVGATNADVGGRDGWMVAGARDVADLLSAHVPVHYYRFSYVAGSADQSAGAQHATEVPFFFNTEEIKHGVQTTALDAAVGKTVSAYVANFARTGNPNGPGLPSWPRYEPVNDPMMDFSTSGEAVAQQDPWG